MFQVEGTARTKALRLNNVGVFWGVEKGHRDWNKANKREHCMRGGWRGRQGPDLVGSCKW